jgi:hypothetical protein
VSTYRKVLFAATGCLLCMSSAFAGENDVPRGSRGPVPPLAPDNSLGVAILSAVVAGSGGTLIGGSGAVSSSDLGTVGNGSYEVIFDRSIVNCAYVGTINGLGTSGPEAGMVNLTGRGGNANGLFVATRSETGALADHSFHVLVFCNK